jgi:hypothetical protein
MRQDQFDRVTVENHSDHIPGFVRGADAVDFFDKSLLQLKEGFPAREARFGWVFLDLLPKWQLAQFL